MKVGDVVTLKGSSVKMTVEGFEGTSEKEDSVNRVRVVWFDNDDDLHHATIDQDALSTCSAL